MIEIKFKKDDIRPGGQFFDDVTEACNRGCKLFWNDDYSEAILQLDTTVFLTKDIITKIIDSGGEITGLITSIIMPAEMYENNLPEATILNWSFNSNEIQSKWKDLFTVVDKQTDGNYKVFLSPSTIQEPLPMSIVLDIFGNDYNIEN